MKNDIQSIKNDQIEPASPEARAERLRRLRNLANLSRKEMCAESGVKIDTLIGWEVARHGGLSEAGSQKIISAITGKGVICTAEWLLYEIGTPPTISPHFEKIKANFQKQAEPAHSIINEEKHIIDELLLFRSHHQDAIDHVVVDDGMLPHYMPGDYVAGLRRYNQNIASLIGYDCIVQLTDGKILLRSLRTGSKENQYTLSCMNANTTVDTPLLFNIELLCAAPVIWIRKKNPV